jgi:hypothetical protein
MKNNRKKIISFFIFIVVFAVIVAIVMFLWNLIIPSVIGWNSINYWQSAGMLILSRLLLSGIGKFQKTGLLFNRIGSDEKFMKDFHEKMKSMDIEERREYIRRRMSGHECDFDNRCEKESSGQ